MAGLAVLEQHLGEATIFGRDVVPFERLASRFPPGSRLNLTRTEVYQECKRVRAPREKTRAQPGGPRMIQPEPVNSIARTTTGLYLQRQ